MVCEGEKLWGCGAAYRLRRVRGCGFRLPRGICFSETQSLPESSQFLTPVSNANKDSRSTTLGFRAIICLVSHEFPFWDEWMCVTSPQGKRSHGMYT